MYNSLELSTFTLFCEVFSRVVQRCMMTSITIRGSPDDSKTSSSTIQRWICHSPESDLQPYKSKAWTFAIISGDHSVNDRLEILKSYN